LEDLIFHAWKQFRIKRASLFFYANCNGDKRMQAQLDSGLTEPILEDTKTWTPYIEEGLIRHIRDRLAYLDGSIAIEDEWCPKLQREGDISIMQALSRLPGVTKGELKKANLCRKWMKVITIAELASHTCKQIQWTMESQI
jgi:hypothetical protein